MRLKQKLGALVMLGVMAIAIIACGDDAGADPQVSADDPKAGWPKVFRLGVFGGDDAETALTNTQPLKRILEAKLGIPVDITTGTSYSAVIEAMRASRVDGMTVGPFAYVLAVQEAGAEALATSISTAATPPVYDSTLLPYYISTVFTKKGSGITSLQDLKGKDFAFVDPASASGHLAPKTLLIKNGINPEKDMKTVFAGSHPTAALSVYNDKTPAGGTNESNLNNLNKSGQVKWRAYPDGQINKPRTPQEIKAVYDACPNGNLVVVAQTDPIPNTPFAVRSDLPASFKAAVKDALLTTANDPEYISVRKNWYVDPAPALGLKTLDSFYNPLRDIAKLLNLNLRELAEGG